MTFRKTVLAYLTGWVIAQATYNRLVRASRRRDMDHPTEEMRFQWRRQAEAIADEMDRRAMERKPKRGRSANG